MIFERVPRRAQYSCGVGRAFAFASAALAIWGHPELPRAESSKAGCRWKGWLAEKLAG